jgi:high-affinity iron transporter
VSAFLLSIREGLEVVLIISIVLGALRRLGRQDLARFIWMGVGAALLISLGVAASLSAAGIAFEGLGEQIFEGLTLLLAAAVLTTMLFWMRSHAGELSARLSAEVRRAAVGADGQAAPTGRPLDNVGTAMFFVGFLAVLREGIELALLLAASAMSSSVAATVAGAGLGLGTAAALGYALIAGAVRLDMRLFFRVSNLVLVLFAAGMIALGVHEFVGAGLLPPLIDPVWNLNPVISDESLPGQLLKTLFGYDGRPALSEVVAYLGYLGFVAWALWLRRRPQPVPAH